MLFPRTLACITERGVLAREANRVGIELRVKLNETSKAKWRLHQRAGGALRLQLEKTHAKCRKSVFLQPNNARAAITPHVAIQRIARIDNQRGQLADALVINLAVIGNDHDAIRRAQLFVSRWPGCHWFAAALCGRVIETHLADERIVIAYLGPFRTHNDRLFPDPDKTA